MTWEFSDVASGSAPGWHGLKITGSAETFAPDFPELRIPSDIPTSAYPARDAN